MLLDDTGAALWEHVLINQALPARNPPLEQPQQQRQQRSIGPVASESANHNVLMGILHLSTKQLF